MRRRTRALCCSAAMVGMVALTSCGSQSTTTPPGPRSASAPPSTQSASPSAGRSPAAGFPLTISRTGGIAGFQDVLVVSGDGLVSATHRGRKQQCRLTPAAAKRLTTAVSQVPWSRITPASTEPSFPDDLVTLLQSPAGGPVRLEDPQLGGGGQIFQDLLNDLGGNPPTARLCRPR